MIDEAVKTLRSELVRSDTIIRDGTGEVLYKAAKNMPMPELFQAYVESLKPTNKIDRLLGVYTRLLFLALSKKDLRAIKCDRVIISHSWLSYSDLNNAQFNQAYVNSSFFSNSNLANARFTNCMFTETNFQGANLLGATFTKCFFKKCELYDVDLSKANFVDCAYEDNHFYQLD